MFYHDLALMISSSKSKKIPSSSTIIFPVISSIWICWSPSSDIITTTASTTNPGFLQSKNTRNTYQYTNDIQWSSGLHPRNLGRAKDAREVGIDSFRFLQRTQTCTLDLLGRFIYIYILYSQIQFPLVARNKLTFEQESYCCQLIEDEPCRLTVVPAD